MKTIIFNGSPRVNGDTSSLVNCLIDKLSGEVNVVNAYRCNISPCLDCRFCKTNPACAIKDEMQSVYAYLEDCDNVVIASPIYFSELTGQMLNIGSRFQMYFSAQFFRREALIKKEKRGGVILVGGGNGDPSKAYDTACNLLSHISCNSVFKLICSHNTDITPAIKDEVVRSEISNLAEFLNTSR